MLHLFLANGFEEIEALATLDILRRLGLEVETVSITGTRLIRGAHGIPVMVDTLYRKGTLTSSDGFILPGGMPGAKNLMASESLKRAIQAHHREGKLIAAICAAPIVLANAGILEGRKVTCYPGFEEQLTGAVVKNDMVVVDGNLITGKGPGAAMPFAFAIANKFLRKQKIDKVKFDMLLDLTY